MNTANDIPLNYDELLKLLKDKGLYVLDEDRAKKYLLTIGYARFKSYFMQQISPSTSWSLKVNNLIDEYADKSIFITKDIMGFKSDWESCDLFSKLLSNSN